MRHWSVAAALVVLTMLSALTIVAASRSIDGTRYFWLDDDQMVSMRYARNLAEGQGLVWNIGERVEGYTSLGWTLVMAGVHRLPLSDATTSLGVKIVAWLLACWIVLLTDRLLLMFLPRPGLARPVVLLTLAACADLVFWSGNGFETTLLTAVFMQGLVMVLEDGQRGSPRAATWLVVSLLPLARSDAYALSAVLLLVSAGLLGRRMLRANIMLVALLPLVQLLFRHAYYGEWLPNTYFLKVAGYSGLPRRGLHYLYDFVRAYVAPLAVAAAGLIWTRDRRIWSIVVASTITLVYIFTVGGDIFPHFRYLAPWVPCLLVLAAVAAKTVPAGGPVLACILLGIIGVTSVIQTSPHVGRRLVLVSGNGLPELGLVAGLLVNRYTSPDATVAVLAAGSVPYLSRRPALDLLGKTDAHIAHLPTHSFGPLGHRKYDMDYSLRKQPDVIVSALPETFPEDAARVGTVMQTDNYVSALLTNRLFVTEYQSSAVPLRYLREQGMVYVRPGSPRVQPVDRWAMLTIAPQRLP